MAAANHELLPLLWVKRRGASVPACGVELHESHEQRSRHATYDCCSRIQDLSGADDRFSSSALCPGPAGSKNQSRSCRASRRKWPAFYAIAEFLECFDHSCSARAQRLSAHRRTAFLVADPLMQNHPEQSAKSMGDSPDGLFVSQTRQQFVKRDLKYAAFDFYR